LTPAARLPALWDHWENFFKNLLFVLVIDRLASGAQ